MRGAGRQSTRRSLIRNDAVIRRARFGHPPLAPELAHRGIDDRVAGTAVAQASSASSSRCHASPRGR